MKLFCFWFPSIYNPSMRLTSNIRKKLLLLSKTILMFQLNLNVYCSSVFGLLKLMK